MTPEQYQRVKEIFDALVDLPAPEWPARLEQLCPDDPVVKENALEMLRADSQAEGSFLESSPLLAFEAQASMIGKRVGAYQIEDQLGSGGMGAVFLASRADAQFQKQVALKIIKKGMDTEEILRRFRSERQILARLDHPHIARLLDGGITEDGVPYFVMEYVEGMPIDAYCDHHKLSLEKRLAIFRKVCNAVQFAHQNLVVHRDIKPGNILVDAEGNPRLLDFGIAKLLNPDDSDLSVPLTETHMRLMTPEYASPEQVRGERISTASDVYSLGVLLYQLLCGSYPYSLKSRRPGELERIICESPPRRPSSRILRSPDSAPGDESEDWREIAARRSLKPEQLRKHLSGDLDNIILMALRKEPNRRYVSVEQFSEDLRRYLRKLPIQARQDTARYRIRKFVRRNRVPVFAGVLILLSLIGGIIGTAWQARVAAAERDRARLEAQKAEEVSKFLTSLFAASDPRDTAPDSLTARQILEEGARKISTELAGQPELVADLNLVIGQVYSNLGDFEAAARHVTSVLDWQREQAPGGSVGVAMGIQVMANIQAKKGDYETAEKSLRESLAMFRRLLPQNDLHIANNLTNLAGLLLEKGDYEEAIALHRQALAIREAQDKPDLADISESLNDLALALKSQGEYPEAEQLYRRALEIREKEYGPDHFFVGQTAHNLGALLQVTGNYEEAEQQYRRGLSISERTLGKDHPDLAVDYNSLAIFFYINGNYEEAAKFFGKALAIWGPTLGEKHPHFATGTNNLGLTLMNLGRIEESREYLEKAMKLRIAALGEDHPNVANSYNNMGRIYHQLKRYDLSERYYRKALAFYEEHSGPEHPNVANTANNLAKLLIDLQKYPEAETLLNRALSIWTASLGEEHPNVGAALNGLGLLHLRRGEYAQAREFLQRARDIYN
ncbi:MAG TPA: tetratricopeptide repeat protein, partial [Calditrichia bacterium]|nr:tetratricopeptide repeat protein [Calditrichia bacterium]